MKSLFLALAAVLALSQSAFALGETKGLGSVFGGGSGGAGGVVDVVTMNGADPTCTRDSLAAWQAAVTRLRARATTAQNQFYSGAIVAQSGCYKMGSAAATSSTAGLSVPPYVKILSAGPVLMDWTAAPSETIAFQINGGNWPYTTSSSALGQAAAGFGYTIDGNNGTITVRGRAGDPSSTCIAIGNISDTTVTEQNTRSGVRGVQCMEWGHSVVFRPYDTYLNTFVDFYSRSPYTDHWTDVATADGTLDNSGEKRTCENCVFSGGQTVNNTPAIVLNTQNRNYNFFNVSFDFIRGSVFHVAEQSGGGIGGYQSVNLSGACHIEQVGGILTVSETVPFWLDINMSGCVYIPGTQKNDFSTTNSWDRPIIDAKGVNLALDDFHIGQTGAVDSRVLGMWFITSGTNVIRARNANFMSSRNLMHMSLVPLPNWNFVSSTVGQFKYDQTPGFYVKNQSSGLNIEVEASGTVPEFGPSLNRLKLTPTGNNSVDLLSAAFPVTTNARLYGWPVVYGGDTTSTLSVSQNIYWLRDKAKPDVSVTAVTKSTNNLTITTAVDHQVDSNTLVAIPNAAEPYAGKWFSVFSVTSQTMRLQVSATYGLPTPVTGTTLAVRPEQVEVVAGTPTVTTDISTSIYGLSTNKAYQCGQGTPNRACWVQTDINRTASTTNDIRVPQGVTKARFLWTLVSNAATSTWWVFPSNLIP
jgi:hypothetical protein